MRVGVVSTDEVQKALFTELLAPLVGDLIMYDVSHAKDGDLEISNAHILLIDMADSNVVECEEVMEALGREEPICLVHDKNLYAMAQRDRISWRNRTIEEIKLALPDLANELDEKRMRRTIRTCPTFGSLVRAQVGRRRCVSSLVIFQGCPFQFSLPSTCQKLDTVRCWHA